MPRVAKISGLNRPPVNTEVLAPRLMARPMGSAHQAYMRLSASVTAIAARPVSASLTVSHRVRVMLRVQANANVRVSSSRAISGAPQKMPMITGATIMTTRPTAYTAGYKVVAASRLRKPMAAELQPPPAKPPWQPVILLPANRLARLGPVAAAGSRTRPAPRPRSRPGRGTGARSARSFLHLQVTAAVTGCGGLAHVGQHQVLQADLGDGPGRVQHRAAGAHQQCGLHVGVAGRDDRQLVRQRGRVAARPASRWWAASSSSTGPATRTREPTSTIR